MSELLFTSRKYNKPYYYDPVSNKTSWSSFGFDINKQLIERANAFKPPDLTKNPMDINPNYAVKSKKYGYNYFFNTETKTSKWEIPRIPVDRIIGLFLDATYSINGISVISKDAILYAGTFNSSKKSTALKSKGEEKQTNPSSFATFIISACHSQGVYASL